MTREEFKKICSEYTGNFSENDGEIKFFNNNILITGFVNKPNKIQKKVYCEIALTKENFLNGFEKTCSILGGFGYPEANEKELRRELQKYNFHKKEARQLSIFDF